MQWAAPKGFVSVFVAAVAVSAVIGVSAAGGISPLGHRAAEEVVSDIETPAATSTGEAAATATNTAEAVATTTPTETPVPEATGTPTPAATATPTPEDDEENGQRDVVGIPTANPSHVDEDGDGVCEKGEVVIKITPSGKSIRIPCQAAEPNGPPEGHGNKHSTPSPTALPSPSPTATSSP